MKEFKFKESLNIEDFLDSKSIFPVFQPLMSLRDASVFGFESFIRFDVGKEYQDNQIFSPENVFNYEKKKNNVWLFDKLCFKANVKICRALGLKKKLFINLNANSFLDKNFQADYIAKYVQKYGIEPSRIIFEISEKEFETENYERIVKTAEYLGENGFQIALDNFGAKSFGFKKIYSLNPNYIKLDKTITKNIQNDEVKQKMVKSLVSFCSEIRTHIVAAGVENEDELRTIFSLGVGAAQGFFIGNSDRIFRNAENAAYSAVSALLYKKKDEPIEEDKKSHQKEDEKSQNKNPKKSAELKAPLPEYEQVKQKTSRIGDFCVYGITFVKETPVPEVLQLFQVNQDCLLAVVLDLEKHILGVVSKSKFLNLFTSQYGFNLYSKKTIGHLMEKDFFSVNENESVIEVSEKAMERDEENVYSPVIVESHGKYKGIVTIKRLLDAIVNVEVADRTRDLMLKNKILVKQRQIQLRDMKMAELVQKSFYKTKMPVLKDWECSFYFKPMASVSGDVYDFYFSKKDEKFLGCSLFDVSGHGVASGLVGILSKYLAAQTFKNSRNSRLDDLLRSFNKSLTEAKGNVENYLTGVFIRTDGGKIEYVNAGHPDVLIKQKNEKTKVLGGQMKNFRGSFIGIEGLPDDFKTVVENVQHDSFILLYTDCFVESRNLMGFELEQNSLRKLFDKACDKKNQKRQKSSSDVLKSVLESFECFTEGVPLKDDLTLIVLHYK